MTDSAITSRREQRMLLTGERLSAVTRRMTAQHGLNGFTIEEVCDEVGISRRTFFNYFPSKEDAVIGADQEDESRQLAEAFLARPARGWGAVLDDLVELITLHFESAGIDATSHAELLAAIEREPRLLTRFMGATREREKQIVALVAKREGVPTDDPHAVAVVNILSTLLRAIGESYFEPDNHQEFGQALSESLAAVRTVFTDTTIRKA
jgi:AcrR family transcriptional regulator